MISEGNDQSGPITKPQQDMVMELHVKWVNGTIQMSAPENDLLFMRLMGDIMHAYAINTAQKRQAQQSRIVTPHAAVVDERLLEKIKENQG